jgi:hypothetical protein
MKLLNEKEFEEYIKLNHESLGESDTDFISQELADTCDSCKREVFLKVLSRTYSDPYSTNELPRFVNLYIQCPSCYRKSFIHLVQFGERTSPHVSRFPTYKHELFKIHRLPVSEENYFNNDIPKDLDSLIKTSSEANYCLSHSKFLASSILYRRALQILAKDVLGAKGKTLFNKLEWLKTNENLLKSDLTDVFHDNSKIIKDVGNQGAHPDDDSTLHDFTKDDAFGLHDLFISIIHEVFVKPKKIKALQDELKTSRKLK